jgi:hypothetical protein
VLTDPSHYEAVNVDLRKDMSLDVEQAPVAPSIAAKVPDGHVAATAVPLGEVKPGSMLLGDLKTSSGQLILADGQILSDRVLVLLRQLSEIDPSVGKINLSVPVT